MKGQENLGGEEKKLLIKLFFQVHSDKSRGQL